jgi:hypothetical protein
MGLRCRNSDEQQGASGITHLRNVLGPTKPLAGSRQLAVVLWSRQRCTCSRQAQIIGSQTIISTAITAERAGLWYTQSFNVLICSLENDATTCVCCLL